MTKRATLCTYAGLFDNNEIELCRVCYGVHADVRHEVARLAHCRRNALESKIQVKCKLVYSPRRLGDFTSKSGHVLEDWVNANLQILACQMPDKESIL